MSGVPVQEPQLPSPFADIIDLLHIAPAGDESAVEAIRQRDRQLTKPPGSLGEL